MRVLITGGSGFLGSHIIDKMLSENINPVVLLRKNSDINRISKILPKCEVIIVEESLEKALMNLKDIFCIIHFGTQYIKSEDLNDIGNLIEGNLTNTITLFEWAEKNKVKKFIFASTFFTNASYDQDGRVVYSEKALNAYAAMKSSAENYIKKRSVNTQGIILKIFTPYGAEDNEKLILSIIKSELDNKPLKIKTPDQGLDLIYIKDLTKLVYKIVSEKNDDRSFKIIDVGSGEEIKVKELQICIRKIVNNLRCQELLGDDLFEKKYNLGSTPVANGQMINYIENFTSLEDGLTETIVWAQGKYYGY